jgi:hypothetical protein
MPRKRKNNNGVKGNVVTPLLTTFSVVLIVGLCLIAGLTIKAYSDYNNARIVASGDINITNYNEAAQPAMEAPEEVSLGAVASPNFHFGYVNFDGLHQHFYTGSFRDASTTLASLDVGNDLGTTTCRIAAIHVDNGTSTIDLLIGTSTSRYPTDTTEFLSDNDVAMSVSITTSTEAFLRGGDNGDFDRGVTANATIKDYFTVGVNDYVHIYATSTYNGTMAELSCGGQVVNLGVSGICGVSNTFTGEYAIICDEIDVR